jgi:nucleoside-diphosphate-sugar epimerase
VFLRPGQIFGGGIPLVNGAVARRAAGRWLVLGDGSLELPLVWIDDVVDAIVAAWQKRLRGGEVIHVIDPEHLTQQNVLDAVGGVGRTIHVPRPVVFGLGRVSQILLGALGRQSPITPYRLRSALAQLTYESNRAVDLLGWRPRVGVREGIRRITEPKAPA